MRANFFERIDEQDQGLVNLAKHTIKSLLPDGYPQIAQTAQVTGTSVRTLQRKLALAEVSYSKLVEQARLDMAKPNLLHSDMKVIDLALELGYEDPSHFARAFRRMTGQSPTEFRSAHASGAQFFSNSK